MVSRASFIDDWAGKLEQGTATLFVGAGVSMGAGYPSWRKLLSKIAEELGLDIDQEHDLAAVAQHFVNKSGGKSRLTSVIAKEFPRKSVPPVLRIVSRLPLRSVWTTNWDELIETAFRENRREPQIMDRSGDLTFERVDADVIVYKMHGSIQHLDDVVLATDDFELYRLKREAFLRVLAAHLISTTFLFVGISFTDPNLNHLLAGIREMYMKYAPGSGGGKPHYAIIRRPSRSDFQGFDNAEAKFNTAKIRHSLFLDDLKRYNIHCVEVDEHDEVERILGDVEKKIARSAVFVSGSIPDGALEPSQVARIRTIGAEVGRVISESGKRLISGYGIGIGDHVLSGMLSGSWVAETSRLDRRLTIRPFPKQLPPGINTAEFNARYREDMIAASGICIVICGIKVDGDGVFRLADGVRAEIEIARRLGRLVVPIGSTGGVAAELWRKMKESGECSTPEIPQEIFDILGDETSDISTIGAAIKNIIEKS